MLKIFKQQSGLAPIIIILIIIALLVGVGAIYLYQQSKAEQDSGREVEGGPCDYDTFRGECKITSIVNGNLIGYRFTPTEPLSEKAKLFNLNREMKEYAGYLGLECLKNKYPITKEDLEKCNIKENAVFDCEVKIIIKGTCTPVIFNFIDTSD